ncbi:MAG: UDP-N-acetylmuramate-L-alanine ligase, partial [Candidatus Levybacteria bacterium GW2011_GWC2_40_7]
MVNKKLKIHFVGIKGVGLAPLAITAKEAGYVISGCDVAEEFITDIPLRNAGIAPLPGFAPNHVDGIDLVITTSAHGGLDNPEVKYAKKQGIRVLTHGEALAQFQSGE